MPATKDKTNVLAELERLEHIWGEKQADASKLSTELGRKLTQHRELTDRRRRAIHNSPGLVDHHGAPLEDDNEIAVIDAEVAELGDLDDLNARVAYARRLADAANAEWADYVQQHYEAIFEELSPEGEALSNALDKWFAAGRQLVEDYSAHANRLVQLTVPIPSINGQAVRETDTAAELGRMLSAWQDVPVPEVRR